VAKARTRYKRVIRLYSKQNKKCAICGRFMCSPVHRPLHAKHFKASETTLDHILPKSKGGSDFMYNLQAACYRCNITKNDGVQMTGPHIFYTGPRKWRHD